MADNIKCTHCGEQTTRAGVCAVPERIGAANCHRDLPALLE